MYDLPDVSVCASLDQLLYDCCSFQFKKKNNKKGYQEVQLVACEIYSLVFIRGEAQIQ